MEYFLIDADDEIPQPQFLNWYNMLRPRDFAAGNFPKLISFLVSLPRDVEFMDIISYPYLMLCEEFTELVRMYDKNIQFKYAMLIDQKNLRNPKYGMPMLETVDCLAPGSELNRDSSVLYRGVLRKEAVRGRTLFQIGGIKNQYVVASLELVESAFRREVLGMRIKELEIV